MLHQFTYIITPEASGITITHFLRSHGYSRKLLIDLKKKEGSIQVDGHTAFLNYLLSPGEQLEIRLHEESGSKHIIPVQMPLFIVYEDEHLIILDKPADMPIHPSQGNYTNTLANGLAWYYQSLGQHFVYRCINRLDRDTTGLLIVAKHKLSASILQASMKARQIKRTYLAIARGTLPDSGTINAPIARKPGSTIERFIDFHTGEPAVTHFQTLLCENNMTLANVQLETGRTHQIRVHMQYIGHPLIGDTLYGQPHPHLLRQALHSHILTFPHPITGCSLTFTSSLPEDMLLFPSSSMLIIKKGLLHNKGN